MRDAKYGGASKTNNTKMNSIFFDYDGVIVDSLECAVKKFNLLMKKFKKSVNVTPEVVRANWKGGWQTLYKNVFGFTEGEIPAAASMYKELGNEDATSIKVFVGMERVIRELSEIYKLYIVSSNYSDNIKSVLAFHHLNQYFGKIFGQDILNPIQKPDPAFIRFPIKELGIQNKDVISIGDSVDDVVMAQAAGIKVIACSWGWQLRKDLVTLNPDKIVDTPEQLLKVIKVF